MEDKLIDSLRKCIRQSTWQTTGGAPSLYFCDMDALIASPDKLNEWAENFAAKIRDIEKVKGSIDKLAFIEKHEGPIGILVLLGMIEAKTMIPSIVVRINKRTLLGSIKGATIKNNDHIIILSDVATKGTSIKKAAQIISEFGGRVDTALVAYDRMNGAKENLSLIGIELVSLENADKLVESGEISKEKIGKKSFQIPYEYSGTKIY